MVRGPGIGSSPPQGPPSTAAGSQVLSGGWWGRGASLLSPEPSWDRVGRLGPGDTLPERGALSQVPAQPYTAFLLRDSLVCAFFSERGSSWCFTLHFQLPWGWDCWRGGSMSQGPGLVGGSAGTPAQVDTCSFFHAGVLPRRGAAPSQPLGPERPGPAPAAAPAQPAPGVTPSPVSALPAPSGSPGPRAALPAPAATPGSAPLAPAVTSGPKTALPAPAVTSGPRSALPAPAAASSPRSALPAPAVTPGSALPATMGAPRP